MEPDVRNVVDHQPPPLLDWPCARCKAVFKTILARDFHSYREHGTEPGQTITETSDSEQASSAAAPAETSSETPKQ